MSAICFSFHHLQIKHFSLSEVKKHCKPVPKLSRHGSRYFSLANTTTGLLKGVYRRKVLTPEPRKRCLRAKADGSQSGPNIEGLEVQESPQNAEVEEDSTEAVKSGRQGSSVLSFLCPLLKFAGGGDPSLPRNELFEVATSSMATIARLPWGSEALAHAVAMREDKGNSLKPLQLYEFEACPFCRRVREAMTELDLSAEVYPCPKGSLRHRELVKRYGGKEQFPYLMDPNTGVAFYESGDIVKYLFQQYGGGKDPSPGLLESTLFTGWVPTILRAGRGMTLWERAKPELAITKLELFSYENNQVWFYTCYRIVTPARLPLSLEDESGVHAMLLASLFLLRLLLGWLHLKYARIVREALCELELPYILHNVGKGSSRTKVLSQIAGSDKVPYLVDPNTGASLSNHKDITSYLFQTYCSAG